MTIEWLHRLAKLTTMITEDTNSIRSEEGLRPSNYLGHNFGVALNLIMKAKLSAKFLLRKLVIIHTQTKQIFTRKAFIRRRTATREWPSFPIPRRRNTSTASVSIDSYRLKIMDSLFCY